LKTITIIIFLLTRFLLIENLVYSQSKDTTIQKVVKDNSSLAHELFDCQADISLNRLYRKQVDTVFCKPSISIIIKDEFPYSKIDHEELKQKKLFLDSSNVPRLIINIQLFYKRSGENIYPSWILFLMNIAVVMIVTFFSTIAGNEARTDEKRFYCKYILPLFACGFSAYNSVGIVSPFISFAFLIIFIIIVVISALITKSVTR